MLGGSIFKADEHFLYLGGTAYVVRWSSSLPDLSIRTLWSFKWKKKQRWQCCGTVSYTHLGERIKSSNAPKILFLCSIVFIPFVLYFYNEIIERVHLWNTLYNFTMNYHLSQSLSSELCHNILYILCNMFVFIFDISWYNNAQCNIYLIFLRLL